MLDGLFVLLDSSLSFFKRPVAFGSDNVLVEKILLMKSVE